MSPTTNRKLKVVMPPGSGVSSRAGDRIRSRNFRIRFQNIRKLWRPFKITVSALLLIGLSYLAIIQLKYIFFETSYFELRQIEVTGIKRLDQESVIAISGAAPGMNILKLDRDEIALRIQQLPGVKSVEVNLSGLYTLRIKIEERVPFVYAKVGTRFFEISQDGYLISTESVTERDLPIIHK